MLFLRGLAIWLVIVFAESLHGTARRLLLEPQVGDLRARQISVFSGALIIFVVACLFARRLRATKTSGLLGIGFLWLILTIIFEIALGRLALNLSWERIFSDYDLASGGLMPIGLIFLTLSPWLAAKTRGLK
jgi:hypothetical protein